MILYQLLMKILSFSIFFHIAVAKFSLTGIKLTLDPWDPKVAPKLMAVPLTIEKFLNAGNLPIQEGDSKIVNAVCNELADRTESKRVISEDYKGLHTRMITYGKEKYTIERNVMFCSLLNPANNKKQVVCFMPHKIKDQYFVARRVSKDNGRSEYVLNGLYIYDASDIQSGGVTNLPPFTNGAHYEQTADTARSNRIKSERDHDFPSGRSKPEQNIQYPHKTSDHERKLDQGDNRYQQNSDYPTKTIPIRQYSDYCKIKTSQNVSTRKESRSISPIPSGQNQDHRISAARQTTSKKKEDPCAPLQKELRLISTIPSRRNSDYHTLSPKQPFADTKPDSYILQQRDLNSISPIHRKRNSDYLAVSCKQCKIEEIPHTVIPSIKNSKPILLVPAAQNPEYHISPTTRPVPNKKTVHFDPHQKQNEADSTKAMIIEKNLNYNSLSPKLPITENETSQNVSTRKKSRSILPIQTSQNQDHHISAALRPTTMKKVDPNVPLQEDSRSISSIQSRQNSDYYILSSKQYVTDEKKTDHYVLQQRDSESISPIHTRWNPDYLTESTGQLKIEETPHPIIPLRKNSKPVSPVPARKNPDYHHMISSKKLDTEKKLHPIIPSPKQLKPFLPSHMEPISNHPIAEATPPKTERKSDPFYSRSLTSPKPDSSTRTEQNLNYHSKPVKIVSQQESINKLSNINQQKQKNRNQDICEKSDPISNRKCIITDNPNNNAQPNGYKEYLSDQTGKGKAAIDDITKDDITNQKFKYSRDNYKMENTVIPDNQNKNHIEFTQNLNPKQTNKKDIIINNTKNNSQPNKNNEYHSVETKIGKAPFHYNAKNDMLNQKIQNPKENYKVENILPDNQTKYHAIAQTSNLNQTNKKGILADNAKDKSLPNANIKYSSGGTEKGKAVIDYTKDDMSNQKCKNVRNYKVENTLLDNQNGKHNASTQDSKPKQMNPNSSSIKNVRTPPKTIKNRIYQLPVVPRISIPSSQSTVKKKRKKKSIITRIFRLKKSSKSKNKHEHLTPRIPNCSLRVDPQDTNTQFTQSSIDPKTQRTDILGKTPKSGGTTNTRQTARLENIKMQGPVNTATNIQSLKSLELGGATSNGRIAELQKTLKSQEINNPGQIKIQLQKNIKMQEPVNTGRTTQSRECAKSQGATNTGRTTQLQKSVKSQETSNPGQTLIQSQGNIKMQGPDSAKRTAQMQKTMKTQVETHKSGQTTQLQGTTNTERNFNSQKGKKLQEINNLGESIELQGTANTVRATQSRGIIGSHETTNTGKSNKIPKIVKFQETTDFGKAR